METETLSLVLLVDIGCSNGSILKFPSTVALAAIDV